MGLSIRQVAAVSGVSTRTLRHYDNIGLLSPTRNAENLYREYGDDDVDRLQQILFFRRCGCRLDDIKRMLDRPNFDRAAALEQQRVYLLRQRDSIDVMLDTLDRTVLAMKGEINMNNKDKFKGFDFTNNPYEQEARELYGDETVDRSKKKLEQTGYEKASEAFNSMFTRLAVIRTLPPDCDEAQSAMDDMFNMFNENFGDYNFDAFEGLGRMYIDDARFTKNVDGYGEGLSQFLCDAMRIYADRHR